MKYQIKHVTTYQYNDKVSLSQNHARLTPQTNQYQRCLSHQLEITPNADYLVYFQDYFNNQVSVFEVPTMHEQMVVTASSEVEILAPPQSLADPQLTWEQTRDQLQQPINLASLQAAEFCLPTFATQPNAELRDYAGQSFAPGQLIVAGCEDLMARIFNEFTFDPAFSTTNTPVSEVFEHKRGVCQDFAHLALSCLRSLGLAARYVSGYIETLPPPGQVKLEGADATHAWIALYVPDWGWLDFDPTNNLQPTEQHVTLAIGRDFWDVTPLKGIMFGGGSHQLQVAVDMKRVVD
ncbi:transglutaminase family protein [Spartinivicinus poritis]|uniref:Transglutaminase family protein n=1 Tax=Spartinivicinus poritis TaxID=2994640 RepID=A0ABT5UD76_9GAMM|nr:transglutaminase family protein [Spartinivicinus sp. A2-2]MDE1464332.1 transglutaminase family protein [Spartinivicinus sp. A2-2]